MVVSFNLKMYCMRYCITMKMVPLESWGPWLSVSFYFDGIGQGVDEKGLFDFGIFGLGVFSQDLHLRRTRTMSRWHCLTLDKAIGELLREDEDEFLLGKETQDETGSNWDGSRVEDDNGDTARHVCLRGWTTLFRGVDGTSCTGRGVRADVSSEKARGACSSDGNGEKYETSLTVRLTHGMWSVRTWRRTALVEASTSVMFQARAKIHRMYQAMCGVAVRYVKEISEEDFTLHKLNMQELPKQVKQLFLKGVLIPMQRGGEKNL